MSIYEIESNTNLDGFDIREFGLLEDGYVKVTQKKELLDAYLEQGRKLLQCSLAPFVSQIKNINKIDMVSLKVNFDGTVSEVYFAADQNQVTQQPQLSAQQLLDLVRIFHIFYWIKVILQSGSCIVEIPYALFEQQNVMRMELGCVICANEDQEITFIAYCKEGLSSLVSGKEHEEYQVGGSHYCNYAHPGTFFPRIISIDQYRRLEDKTQKLVAAAKTVLGPEADLDAILAYFEQKTEN